MKGLLIKDIMLLKNQKQSLVVVLFIGLIFLLTNENPSGAMSYLMIVSSMYTMNTISYDEFDNGLGYLFTLPISRKNYVQEKYIFGILTVVAVSILITVLTAAICVARQIHVSPQEYGVILAVDFVMAVFIFSLQIPIKLKFRAEKSGIAMMTFLVCVTVIGAALIKLLEVVGVKPDEVIDKIESLHVGSVTFGCLVLALTLLLISYIISIRIMKNKEF